MQWYLVIIISRKTILVNCIEHWLRSKQHLVLKLKKKSWFKELMILIFDIVLTDYLKKTVLLKAVKIYVKLSLSKKKYLSDEQAKPLLSLGNSFPYRSTYIFWFFWSLHATYCSSINWLFWFFRVLMRTKLAERNRKCKYKLMTATLFIPKKKDC